MRDLTELLGVEGGKIYKDANLRLTKKQYITEQAYIECYINLPVRICEYNTILPFLIQANRKPDSHFLCFLTQIMSKITKS